MTVAVMIVEAWTTLAGYERVEGPMYIEQVVGPHPEEETVSAQALYISTTLRTRRIDLPTEAAWSKFTKQPCKAEILNRLPMLSSRWAGHSPITRMQDRKSFEIVCRMSDRGLEM
jgi:hypothetical protein